jgi:pimeloyl-ACP methyl ester carboxylesterase
MSALPLADALPPIVLLHGLGTGPSAWRPQVERLEAQRRVLAPSLVPALAAGTLDEAVVLVERTLRGTSTADVCGLSLGGVVAMRFAIDHPGTVRRLAVCSAFDHLPGPARARERVAAAGMRLMGDARVRRRLVSDVPEPYRSQALAELAPVTARQAARWRDATGSLELDVTRIEAPTLVLYGERDQASRASSERLASRIPDSELEVVERAGRVANLDQPDAFTEALERFFA